MRRRNAIAALVVMAAAAVIPAGSQVTVDLSDAPDSVRAAGTADSAAVTAYADSTGTAAAIWRYGVLVSPSELADADSIACQTSVTRYGECVSVDFLAMADSVYSKDAIDAMIEADTLDVASVNDSTGAVTITAGTGITVTPSSPATFTIAATGGGGTDLSSGVITTFADQDTLEWEFTSKEIEEAYGFQAGYFCDAWLSSSIRLPYYYDGGANYGQGHFLLPILQGIGSRDTLEIIASHAAKATGNAPITYNVKTFASSESILSINTVADTVRVTPSWATAYAVETDTGIVTLSGADSADTWLNVQVVAYIGTAAWTTTSLYFVHYKFRLY